MCNESCIKTSYGILISFLNGTNLNLRISTWYKQRHSLLVLLLSTDIISNKWKFENNINKKQNYHKFKSHNIIITQSHPNIRTLHLNKIHSHKLYRFFKNMWYRYIIDKQDSTCDFILHYLTISVIHNQINKACPGVLLHKLYPGLITDLYVVQTNEEHSLSFEPDMV